MIEKIQEKISKANDKTLTKLDSISKELEEMRQEGTIGNHQNQQLKEKVENHEKRIQKLEQATIM